jgi:hypothetical protein
MPPPGASSLPLTQVIAPKDAPPSPVPMQVTIRPKFGYKTHHEQLGDLLEDMQATLLARL